MSSEGLLEGRTPGDTESVGATQTGASMSVKDSGSTAGRGAGRGVGRVGRVAGSRVGVGAVISDGRPYVGGGAGGSPADIARGGTGSAVTCGC